MPGAGVRPAMIDETVREIRRMESHSSTAVAVKAARALTALTDREFAGLDEYERALERNSSALRRANPSHASLFTTQREIVDRVVGAAADVAEAKRLTESAVAAVVESAETGRRLAAANAAETLADGECLLTHDYSSTVLDAVETAAADGRDLTVHVTEARPRYLGRKTARHLATVDGVEPHLLVDAAAGELLSAVDRVLIGMDCIVEETLYNRVGTFPIAATAAELGVPVQVVGSSAKIIDGGFVFENEFRPPAEVSLEPLEGVEIENPAYDATPTALLDGVLTDEGRIDP